jgi:DNA-binding response OmpR family regulator
MAVNASEQAAPSAVARGKVLIVDDDLDITDIVRAILTDEGFSVSVLNDQDPDAIRAAVGQFEPDCVLLDGQSPQELGQSWDDAAWVTGRARRVPLIMFTAHGADAREAEAGSSERSRAAGFASILHKPFDIDELVDQVGGAIGLSVPFDGSEQAERDRTAALVARLEAAGAQDIHTSTRREWASFRTTDGALVQLYWWQGDGVYYVGRYAEAGGVMETLGRFYDLDEAIAMSMTVRHP